MVGNLKKKIDSKTDNAMNDVSTIDQATKLHKAVVCIPAYLAEDYIAKLVLGALRVVDQVIVCDDGSNDLTYDIAESMGAIVVKHEQSQGYYATLKTLFNNAVKSGADLVVTIDASGQYNPADIPKLLDRIELGDADVVIGSRYLGGESAVGRVGARVLGSVGNKLTDAESGFRVFSAKALNILQLADEETMLSPELLTNAHTVGIKIAEVSIRDDFDGEIVKKKGGVFDFFLNPLRSVSQNKPLQLYGVPGLLAVVAAIGFGGYAVLTFLSYGIISYFALTVGMGLLCIGFTLIVTSIILWVLPHQNKRDKS